MAVTSTLLALIRGEIQPEAGEYSGAPGLAMTAVSQDLPEADRPLIEYILDGDLELRTLERRIAQLTDSGDGERLALLHGELEHAGGYAARSRAGSAAQHASISVALATCPKNASMLRKVASWSIWL